jgi:hypothetical protein
MLDFFHYTFDGRQLRASGISPDRFTQILHPHDKAGSNHISNPGILKPKPGVLELAEITCQIVLDGVYNFCKVTFPECRHLIEIGWLKRWPHLT